MPDDLDRDLAGDADDGRFLRAFDRLAGPPPDPLAALAGLHRRAGPTATRRGPRLAVGLAAAAVTLAFLAAVGHRGDDHDPSVTARPVVTAAEARVLDASTTSMPITVDASAASTPVPATAGSTTRDPSPAGTDPDGSPGATVDSSLPERPAPPGGSTGRDAGTSTGRSNPPPPSVAPPSGAGSVATTAAAGPEPTAAPPATAPPATEPSAITAPWAARTFRTAGGTVTVRVIGGAFQAPVVVAEAGWSAEVRKAETDRVEVRFRGGPSDDDLSLKLSLGSDGSIVVDGG